MDTLHELLTKTGKYHPEYANGLAMHLPMVLIALNRLQASDDKLRHTLLDNRDELETVTAHTDAITANDLQSNLGQWHQYPAYLSYFRQRIEKSDVEQVLKQHCDLLLPGLAASAFHAVIRLAYAIEIKHTDEIAIALAYWAARYQAFETSQQQTALNLEQILASVAKLGVEHHFSPGIIVERMDEIGQLLKQGQQAIQPLSISYEQIRQFVLQAFYAQDDFTLLHTVTGCSAFSKILPFASDRQSALRYLWQAIVVAYLSTGLPFQSQALPQQVVSLDMFAALKPLALQSDESHKIKLYYTCLCEYLSCGDSGYYWLAKRALVEG